MCHSRTGTSPVHILATWQHQSGSSGFNTFTATREKTNGSQQSSIFYFVSQLSRDDEADYYSDISALYNPEAGGRETGCDGRQADSEKVRLSWQIRDLTSK